MITVFGSIFYNWNSFLSFLIILSDTIWHKKKIKSMKFMYNYYTIENMYNSSSNNEINNTTTNNNNNNNNNCMNKFILDDLDDDNDDDENSSF